MGTGNGDISAGCGCVCRPAAAVRRTPLKDRTGGELSELSGSIGWERTGRLATEGGRTCGYNPLGRLETVTEASATLGTCRVLLW